MGLPTSMDESNQTQAEDVIRCIAHDSATNAVPLKITGEPDFDSWAAVVSELADDIERNIRQAKEMPDTATMQCSMCDSDDISATYPMGHAEICVCNDCGALCVMSGRGEKEADKWIATGELI